MIDAFFDWIGREGWIIVNWWLLASAAGIAALPLLMRLLDGLPDRGYTLARPAGILLTGYVFWILAVLGFVQNTAGSMILAWLVVLVIGLLVYFRYSAESGFDLRSWWRDNSRLVIITELLFLVLLVGMALYRAHQNDLTTTEKPMDLAFMSASQRTLEYPPNDPWLSGYIISYYYFGYVLAAMFSTLAGVQTTIGYNMHLALLFALAGTAVFGIGYNLVRSRVRREDRYPTEETDELADISEASQALIAASRRGEKAAQGRASARNRTLGLLTGLFAMTFLVLIGSYQLPLVEWPFFSGRASADYLEFWAVNERETPISGQGYDNPADWVNVGEARGDLWYFRTARPISDDSINGGHIEVIAEFPIFSFVLGDSHPHVMALPFVLLAIGLALNIILSDRRPDTGRILLYGLCVGALVFLNTWDTPIYIMTLVGAELLRRYRREGRLDEVDWLRLFIFGLSLLVITLVAYAPFLIGFQSQLGGVLPNLINPTKTQQLFLLFGPFLIILPFYIAVEVWRGGQLKRMNWSLAAQAIVGIFVLLVILLLAFTSLGLFSDELRRSALAYVDQNGGLSELLPQILEHRLEAILTPIIGLLALFFVIARLFPKPVPGEDDSVRRAYPVANGFALMLVGAAFSLILLPEVVYLRDNFGTRMNTVFKFYYQAWVVLSIACAYGVYTLLADHDQKRPALAYRGFFSLVLVGVLLVGLAYPVFALPHRAWITSGLRGAQEPMLTLDGGPGFVTQDDYNAIMCLGELVGQEPDVVIAEADPFRNEGRINYNPRHGRVGSLTGIPVLLGWPGHQSQWRGTSYNSLVDPRATRDGGDIRTLYEDPRYDTVLPIIQRYGIDYIIYGATEQSSHGAVGEEKFRDNLPVVCESGNTRIYRVIDTAVVGG